MKMNTRIFGEVDIDDEKVICFPNGIVGFPELTEFALIHDEEEGENVGIRWMQSVQEPAFAMPVISPLTVCGDYNPQVEDELLKPVGELEAEDMLVLTTITIPHELEKMSVNLKAPFIINSETKKAVQIIIEGEQYQVKFPVYDILQAKKAGE